MCTVSNIGDYGRQLWPTAPVVTPTTAGQQVIYVPTAKVPTPEEWAAFMELVEKARKFDELAEQPDCEDAEKTAWMDDMARRVARLEERVSGQKVVE